MNNKPLKPINLSSIVITDPYWRRYTDLVPNVIIPYQWAILNDKNEGMEQASTQKTSGTLFILNDKNEGTEPSHCLRNYKIAAGELEGERSGVVFIDTDVTKWLEAVAYSLQSTPNAALEKDADEVIALLKRAQRSDGYLNTYFTLEEPGKQWTNLTEGHELYCAGHMIEAAVAYYESTGKDELLHVGIRFADLICSVFGTGENQIQGYPGHQEIELALIKLYRVTLDKKYLEQAKYFIDQRGQEPNYFLEEMKRNGRVLFDEFKDYDPTYSQSHMPPRNQTTAEGHAVRAMYMYSAMADLAHETNDEELLKTCDTLWNNVVNKRMYLTGSVGSSAKLERFTADYDLPNDTNYSETCASIGLAMFGSRMSWVKKDASYYDVVEKTLYSTVLAGMSLKGDSYFYVNPLEVWPDNCLTHTSMEHVKPVRQKWFNVACCPTNIARTLASLGKYIVALDENTLYLNLFISHASNVHLNGTKVFFELESTFLRDGRSILRVRPERPAQFDVNIRIPSYVRKFAIKIDGVELSSVPVENGYAKLSREWSGETAIEIDFDIVAQFVAAHPEVRADAGKVAIVKGPIVYCLEEIDNGDNLASVIVSADTQLQEYFDPTLLGGTSTITFTGRKISNEGWGNELYKAASFKTEPVELKAIPYCLWGNRGENEMLVWMKASI